MGEIGWMVCSPLSATMMTHGEATPLRYTGYKASSTARAAARMADIVTYLAPGKPSSFSRRCCFQTEGAVFVFVFVSFVYLRTRRHYSLRMRSTPLHDVAHRNAEEVRRRVWDDNGGDDNVLGVKGSMSWRLLSLLLAGTSNMSHPVYLIESLVEAVENFSPSFLTPVYSVSFFLMKRFTIF